MKPKVLALVHDSPLGGHSGYLKTFVRAKRDWHWQGMKQDVKSYIKGCEICQRIKSETCKPVGLLQPLSIPSKLWHSISMDFIKGLPTSNKQNVILVVVDRLTKYVHFVALAHLYTASRVATLFMHHVFKLHVMPSFIVSDRILPSHLYFGKNCLGSKELNWQLVHPIILKVMGKLKLSIEAWSNT